MIEQELKAKKVDYEKLISELKIILNILEITVNIINEIQEEDDPSFGPGIG